MPSSGAPRATQTSTPNASANASAPQVVRLMFGCGSRLQPAGDEHWRVSNTPSTTSSSASISVMSGAPANIIGSVTSATARNMFSPTRCAVNQFSMRWVFAITPTTGSFIAAVSLGSHFAGAQIGKRVIPAAEEASSRNTSAAKLKRDPAACRPAELFTRARDYARVLRPAPQRLRASDRCRKNRPTPDRCHRDASSGRRALHFRCEHRAESRLAARRTAVARRHASPVRQVASVAIIPKLRTEPRPLRAIRASRRCFNAASR